MSTTPVAKKRSLIAGLGLSIALILGALVPFFATAGTASAASPDCSAEGAAQARAVDHYNASARQVSHAAKKYAKAKKRLKKDKKHHAAKHVIKKDKHKKKKAKKRLRKVTTRYRNAASGVGRANGALLACRAVSGQGGSNPLGTQVNGPLGDTPLKPLCYAINLPGLCTTTNPDPGQVAADLQTLVTTLTNGLNPATMSDPQAFSDALQAGIEQILTDLNPGGGTLPYDLTQTVNDLADALTGVLFGSGVDLTDPASVQNALLGALSSVPGGGSMPSADSFTTLLGTVTGALGLSSLGL
jgi:hypothetical protein